MTAESLYLAIVLAAALVSFYLQRLRPDVTALLVMLSLLVPWRPTETGLRAILTPGEAFHGFGSPALIMVASMFVLSAAMVRTGATQLLGGQWTLISTRSNVILSDYLRERTGEGLGFFARPAPGATC